MISSREKCPTSRRALCFLRLALLVFVLPCALLARPFIVLVYNVENLFDADSQALFRDYQPPHYTRQHVLTKLESITHVVSQFEGGRGPDIILFQEIEVDQTNGEPVPDYDAILRRYAHTTIRDMLGERFDAAVADLPAEALLLKAMADRGMTGYTVVRGEAVQLEPVRALAQKNVTFTRFPVRRAASHPTLNARAILEVEVEVDGARLYLFNNHWKSGAGSLAEEQTRIANARTLRDRLDAILAEDPSADIIVAGDFNSQHNQKQRYPQMGTTALGDVLGSQGDELAIRRRWPRALYNLWFELPPEERASDAYQGEWGTLMQMLLTRGLYDYRGVQYVDNSFGVARLPGVNVSDNGLPKRWSFAGPRGSGFSDHLPIYAKFITVDDGDTERGIWLKNPSANEGIGHVNWVDFSKIDIERVALRLSELGGAAALRDDALKGRIIRVVGRRAAGSRLAVLIDGESFDVWIPEKELRDRLRQRWRAGASVQFYGELGQYGGRWQFVIRDPSWVK
ncbi:hypothetical protein AXK12_01365 [Cephaloticoccus capnophilus]|uniref:Endonuclease/exonuclease/phosphatase domain-containing protein n=1 Tax=Cephaloticoccus capnophilus TaxID=1548208 RepID=A0A139STE7_9BACT|nr:endonuclease/exonuclease/phosphatase family protein [Cephaloticoccus capnophilus]KXU37835.1 hypothetical protein AXK12_01365 [Cephaloticoccus capnophilus]